MNSNTKLFLGILFFFAAVGLVVVLNTNPSMFFFSIALAAGVIFFLNRFMTTRRPNDKGYQKALKTQKKRKLTPTELQKLTKLKRSPKDIPFKVIEGNKKGRTPKEKQTNSNIH